MNPSQTNYLKRMSSVEKCEVSVLNLSIKMQKFSNKWVKHLLRFGKTCKVICVLQLLPKLFELMKLFIDLICGIPINNIF